MGSLYRLSDFYVFSIFLILAHQCDANLAEKIRNSNDRLLRNVQSYEMVQPYLLNGGRAKRDISTKLSDEDGHMKDVTIVLPGTKTHFKLDLSLKSDLFGPNFEERFVTKDGSRLAKTTHENCFYQGTVAGAENSDVSLSTCDGIEGIIKTNSGTYFIQPLKSHDSHSVESHILFNADDLKLNEVTCGHSLHRTTPGKNIKHVFKRSSDFQTRFKRDVLSETKYVEFFVINDRKQHDKYGENVTLRTKTLVNHLDSIYRVHNIRIALVRVDTLVDETIIWTGMNASIGLKNFEAYIKNKYAKDKGKHFDNAQLITGEDFKGTTVGYAPIQTICDYQRSAAVVQDWDDLAAVTAATMAHELGHNFGMHHDQTNCECPEEEGTVCIMSATLTRKPSTKFSSCSRNQLKETLENGYGQCLFDQPIKIYGSPICGNGFVEEGEQCDCGTKTECDRYGNKCCNSTTCMLHPDALCAHGECCDKNRCQLKSRGILCREKTDDCDLSEYCTGDNELCPTDHHVHNGIPCKDNEGYCYGGICRSLKLQCQFLFGNDVQEADDRCFLRNKDGSPFYHCLNGAQEQQACREEDVKCGRIHCLSNDPNRKPIRGQNRGSSWLTFDRKSYCLVPIVTWSDGMDPQYVQNGTKCAEGKMCYNGKCLPVNETIPMSANDKCPNYCSGNGICNNKGNCHCYNGYACPDCKERGSGGSRDSGQGCIIAGKKGGVNIVAAILIPIFLIILIGVAILVYIQRRTIRDRLSHYKFVRRNTNPPSRKPPARQPSGLHSGLISNPTLVEQSPANRNERPANRPIVPLVPKVPSYSEVNQEELDQGVQPPPPPYNTGHRTVALFPPNAPPDDVLYENTKPKPAPPVRPLLKSNLPRTPSAPPTSINNKPKIPPARPNPNYKSTPDITAPEKPVTPKRPKVVPPRPKPRAFADKNRSVPDHLDEIEDTAPTAKPRNVGPRRGHQSVPLFDLPDNSEDEGFVRPSAVKASQARPFPAKRPGPQRDQDDNDKHRVDFRAGLRPVPKPWDKS
ncbi:zinc metalloproteinase-disintegrin-like jararhagin isoform X2 [Xenia sp. Carnegie-2017]|uniref:zinc metalloproteinase-disintegrin-like jararhagin isoform X2 n=1 Tax=Xenia sp. Carnegie-2017 TaxID=2897299 RepID=UPI001F03AB78|nr:zinc metalloproteinase-disintegrin-like jararhagin isoform X2 [Xenia sp. Carnegie-2017]